MSCIRPDPEPDFEPVTLRRRFLNTLASATSSPKLRLDFDRESFMAADDFENFIASRDQSVMQRAEGFEGHPDLQRRLSNLDLLQQDESSSIGRQLETTTAAKGILVPGAESDCGSCIERDSGVTVRSSTVTTPKPVNTVSPAASIDNTPTHIEGLGDKGDKKATLNPKLTWMTKAKKQPLPPAGVMPRVGTLTALPGSSVIVSDDGEGNGVTSSSSPITKASRTARPASASMPPPPTPAVGGSTNLCTPLSTPPNRSSHSHKRKLSLSAPFIDNFKKILTPTGARKPLITHLTHDKTARSQDEQSSSHVTSEPSTKTTSPHRDLITPIFAGPSSTHSDSKIDIPTTRSRLRHAFTHRRTPTDTSANPSGDPTSKPALNALIVQLRGQISDLTLENRVLKDQIAIVRKDWIDTARELDVERHRSWEGEMAVFRQGVRIEELSGEVRRLKRGSVLD